EQLGEYGALLWLLALVPGFLLAYYKGWKGAATALALGMATLSLTQALVAWLGLSVPDTILGVVAAYVGISLGIGALAERLHRDRAEVEDMAFTDLLTRLPNRRHARLFLESEFAAAQRGRALSVVLFDLDRFKAYNDDHGHQAGDQALKAFAEILDEVTRRMDLSGRFGGEEFVSILTGTDADGAVVFADRVRQTLEALTLPSGTHLTVSAGVASYRPTMVSPDEFLAAADHALYEAKREGRNRVSRFPTPPAHRPPSQERQKVDALLRVQRREPPPYPRASDELGRTPPPQELLPELAEGYGVGYRALVVEDDPQVRELIQRCLLQDGFEVVTAEDVAGAEELLAEEFDLVVTDIGLPGASGRDVVSFVKSRWPATQVLVVTALHDAQVAAGALGASADRYLFKPFRMADLRRHAAGAVDRRTRTPSGTAHGGVPESVEDGPPEDRPDSRAVLRGAHALTRAVAARDGSSLGAGERVSRYAECLARILDPTEEVVGHASLHLACQLYDVGKIGVPDSILTKEGELTPEEAGQMRSHPLQGHQILEPLTNDRTVLDVVLLHHENWDGSGYPQGRSGDGIPLAAQIVGMCDALEAMTQDRAFRKARPWSEALDELRRMKGTRFSPELIGALDSAEAELRRIFREASTADDGSA
ncbi:MAG: diguanylate cyclase, partial [Gemmatimonadota bacterium]|nr:diguanylate cyclase [Gemmatimonadota bacterium]